ncbi:type II toxin -antitoxin system TacA 1-like antitoxin [Streptomyces sp. NPDC003032]
MGEKTAMNLRFPDPEQRAAIAAAAQQAGVSMQEYILSAAYERATAVEQRFLDAFGDSMARSGAAFAAETTGGIGPTAEQRAAERQARAELEQQGRGQAA